MAKGKQTKGTRQTRKKAARQGGWPRSKKDISPPKPKDPS